jgi:hypothetical protein
MASCAIVSKKPIAGLFGARARTRAMGGFQLFQASIRKGMPLFESPPLLFGAKYMD